MADDFLGHKRFLLSTEAVALALSFLEKRSVSEVAEALSQGGKYSAVNWVQLAQSLQNSGLLTEQLSPKAQLFRKTRAEWQKRGWGEASYYHLLCLDYDFLDYTVAKGFLAERGRMEGYYAAEQELPRSKRYDGALAKIELPKPSETLLPTPISKVYESKTTSALDANTVFKSLSMTFGKVKEMKLRQQGTEPLILKTSPSGGGRHPTEAYLINLSIPGIEVGWFHVEPIGPALELLHRSADPQEVKELFFGAYRAPFPIRAIVVLTSLFERNMYRYREPRTFRSVHLDAGHCVATMEACVRSLGLGLSQLPR